MQGELPCQKPYGETPMANENTLLTTPSTDSSAAANVPRFRAAYERLADEIRAVPESALIKMNLDIPTAVTTVLGALPEIRSLRSRIVAELPLIDITRFDKIEDYTLAVAYAHSVHAVASVPAEVMTELSETAAKWREVLFSDASALAKRGLVNPQRLKDLKGPVGYRNLAFDLLSLSAALREDWSRIQGKTALELTELDEAETLADRMLTTLGEREQGPATAAVSAEMRQRAFSLFVKAYDLARRAVLYLRWHERDMESIAPSLYAGRGNTRRRHSDLTPEPTAVSGLKAQAVDAPAAAEATKPSEPGLLGGDEVIEA